MSNKRHGAELRAYKVKKWLQNIFCYFIVYYGPYLILSDLNLNLKVEETILEIRAKNTPQGDFKIKGTRIASL